MKLLSDREKRKIIHKMTAGLVGGEEQILTDEDHALLIEVLNYYCDKAAVSGTRMAFEVNQKFEAKIRKIYNLIARITSSISPVVPAEEVEVKE